MSALSAENPGSAATFERDGVLFPIKVLASDEVAALKDNYERVFLSGRANAPKGLNKKPHLLLPWLNRLVRDERIVSAVTPLLGPDVLLWSSMFFTKPAGDPAYVA